MIRPPRHSPYVGPLPPLIWATLLHIQEQGGSSLQSDFARALPLEIALAASCGWLTVISSDNTSYSNKWRITASGMIALQHKDDFTPCLYS